MERRTKAQLVLMLVQAESDLGACRRQNDELLRDYHAERDRFDQQRRELIAHKDVLLGDRDRLTATVEVLSRRLASPYADKDPVRGGWRGAQQATDPHNLKAIDPIAKALR
jgi:hypothetical protein